MSQDSDTYPAVTISQHSAAADPAANALQHGLTATRYLPKILQTGRLEELLRDLRREYRPATISEELLVNEIARHAAVLEVTEQAEPAVWRTAAQALSPLVTPDPSAPSDDILLAAAVTAEPLDRAARYRRGHEKALHQSLDKLHQLQATRQPKPWNHDRARRDPFATIEDCEAHLLARFAAPDWKCPKCRQAHGQYKSTRRCWECDHCQATISLRHGTVFQNSRLPLTTWFRVIRTFVGSTSISAKEVMAMTGICRVTTARSMLRRIRRAVDERDVVGGLAGLTNYPLELPPVPNA